MQQEFFGQSVERVTSEFLSEITLSGGIVIQLESAYVLTLVGEDPVLIDPTSLTPCNPMSHVVGKVVEDSVVEEVTGALVISFTDGSKLSVEANREFEAWTLNYPDGRLIVSLPGGGVSRWDASS